MASSIAHICTNNDRPTAEALGDDAAHTRHLHLPCWPGYLSDWAVPAGYSCTVRPAAVVAGYLAFVGLFCLQAGLALAAGVEINMISQWANLWSCRAGPEGAASPGNALTMMWVMRKPGLMPLLLAGSLTPRKGASTSGMCTASSTSSSLDAEGHLTASHVGANPQGCWASSFVVAFGSSLDIAAIQAEMPTLSTSTLS
ncbi:hypothetical protein WJX84_001497 [Apatococcus fuscideae]|uniref:Uncharacterized protein n=1 Tax=Apatococcus fuscideae TaxID=2026836 RepID=A0AAW1THE3_9CHLO